MYSPPPIYRSGHLQTIFPTLFRTVLRPNFQRERLELSDGDFLDLDWLRESDRKRIAIITHGLEGSTNSKYVQGLTHHLYSKGWNICAWNFRGCSGEPNRLLPWYHSGRSDDLRAVVEHVLKTASVEKIALIGISVGGNITLKYLGEEGTHVNSKIAAACSLSAPLDLEECAYALAKFSNTIYMKWFLSLLKKKITAKIPLFPESISLDGYHKLRTFYDFDSKYTAPLNGFSSAKTYWSAASSLPLLHAIRVPALLLSSRDDPFLGPKSFPENICRDSKYLSLEATQFGGHVGFLPERRGEPYWHELRIAQFLEGIS